MDERDLFWGNEMYVSFSLNDVFFFCDMYEAKGE